MAKYTPLVISDDGKQHIVAPEGSAIDNAYLVSSQQGNAIVAGSDEKLYVAPVTAGKGIDIDDNEVAVKTGELISREPGNILQSKDDGLFVQPAPLEQGKGIAINGTTISVSPSEITNDLVSAVPNNNLSVAADGKLYASVTSAQGMVSPVDGNMITTDTEGRLKVDGNSIVSNGTTNNLLTINPIDRRLQVDGNQIAQQISSSVVIVSDDANNILRRGSDRGAFLSEAMLPDQVSAGEGIRVAAGEVSVNYGKGLTIGAGNRLVVDEDNLDLLAVEVTDKILSVTTDKKLSATVRAEYNGNTGYFYLYGKNNEILSTIYIPGATSALSNVVLVDDPSGYPPGKYFKYTFAITSTGGTTDLYVQVPININVLAGNGIEGAQTESALTLSAKVKPDGGLGVDSTGLYVAAEYATKTELNNLDDRLTDAEATIEKLEEGSEDTPLGSKIAALEADMLTAQGQITNIEAKDTEQDGKLDELLNTTIPALQATDVSYNARLEALEAGGGTEALAQRVTTNEGNIATLQTDVLARGKFTSSATSPETSTIENNNGVFYPATDLLNW